MRNFSKLRGFGAKMDGFQAVSLHTVSAPKMDEVVCAHNFF
jgi:hypothetical protein